jgi:hypothetical protein
LQHSAYITVSIITLSISIDWHYADCRYAGYRYAGYRYANSHIFIVLIVVILTVVQSARAQKLHNSFKMFHFSRQEEKKLSSKKKMKIM